MPSVPPLSHKPSPMSARCASPPCVVPTRPPRQMPRSHRRVPARVQVVDVLHLGVFPPGGDAHLPTCLGLFRTWCQGCLATLTFVRPGSPRREREATFVLHDVEPHGRRAVCHEPHGTNARIRPPNLPTKMVTNGVLSASGTTPQLRCQWTGVFLSRLAPMIRAKAATRCGFREWHGSDERTTRQL